MEDELKYKLARHAKEFVKWFNRYCTYDKESGCWTCYASKDIYSLYTLNELYELFVSGGNEEQDAIAEFEDWLGKPITNHVLLDILRDFMKWLKTKKYEH